MEEAHVNRSIILENIPRVTEKGLRHLRLARVRIIRNLKSKLDILIEGALVVGKR